MLTNHLYPYIYLAISINFILEQKIDEEQEVEVEARVTGNQKKSFMVPKKTKKKPRNGGSKYTHIIYIRYKM